MRNEENIIDTVSEKLEDLTIPGFIAEVTPIEAEIMGAFSEEALSEEEAKEAAYD